MKKSTIALVVLAASVGAGYTAYQSILGTSAVTVATEELQSKFAEYAKPQSFTSAQELNAMMNSDKDVVVIGALNPLRPNQPIAGSFTMWRNDYSAASNVHAFGGMQNTIGEMEAILSSYGATPESTIVVYASGSHHDASRLFWQIKSLGHADVRYLDGGLNAWIGESLPTGSANPTVAATNYQAPNPQVSDSQLASLDMVLEAQNSDEWVIIDTRSPEEVAGSTTANGAFGPGSIPTSIHINWTESTNEDTTLKSTAELKALYGDLVEGKKVISYCQSGVRSAHTTMLLSEVLGAETVYNYDGSWIEYSFEHYEAKNENVNVINGRG